MKVLVIGGTGHVSRFTVPLLVEAGCEVIVVGSGRTPMLQGGAWAKAKFIAHKLSDDDSAEELVATRPDTVIDMLGVSSVYEKFKGSARHFVVCGSLWMLGDPQVVPTPEETYGRSAFDGYAKRFDRMLELQEQSARDGLTYAGILPPNICGPGKVPLECMGGRSIEVHKQHAAGQEVVLPDGPECLIGPCDAEDIGQLFAKAVLNPDKAQGQIFNVGSAYALTASQFVAAYGEIYGVEIPIRKVGWREYIEKVNPEQGAWWHFKAHMCPDIGKARRLLGFEPEHTAEQTVARAVDWMRQEKLI